MFNSLRKKPAKSRVQFVKERTLTTNGELITYSTRLDGRHVPHSIDCDYTKAKEFFDQFVRRNFSQTIVDVITDGEYTINPSSHVS